MHMKLNFSKMKREKFANRSFNIMGSWFTDTSKKVKDISFNQFKWAILSY